MNAFGEDFKYNIIRNPGPFFQCCLFKKEFLLNNIDSFDNQSVYVSALSGEGIEELKTIIADKII